MKAITYLKGDATVPRFVNGATTVICHCCNAFGGWGRGFVIPLGLKYPQAKIDYINFCRPYQTSNVKRNELMGSVCLSKVNDNLYVANLIGQYYYSKNQRDYSQTFGVEPEFLPTQNGRFVSYDSIRLGFRKLVSLMNEVKFSVQMPKMGCGLAGGDWKIIEKIIIAELCSNDIEVTIYEL